MSKRLEYYEVISLAPLMGHTGAQILWWNSRVLVNNTVEFDTIKTKIEHWARITFQSTVVHLLGFVRFVFDL